MLHDIDPQIDKNVSCVELQMNIFEHMFINYDVVR